MKKLSSKIIIFLLVTTFLFCGVNFGWGKSNIEVVYALTTLEESIKIKNAADDYCREKSNYVTCRDKYLLDGGPPQETKATPTKTVPETISAPAPSTEMRKAAEDYCREKSNYRTCRDKYLLDGGPPQETVATSTEEKEGSVGWTLAKLGIKAADIASGIFFTGPAWVAIMLWLVPIIGILGGIAAIVAGVFDLVLNISISTFGNIVDSAGITTAWEMIRNVINISFIFILLYISISIILGDFGPKKKSTVAGVVISALLINFSLFITRIIIDFGNIIAVAIYNSPGGAFTSSALMTGLQIQTVLTPANLSTTGQINSIILTILTMAMTVTFIGVLFRGIVFMIGRLVALIALLALSPIGFVGFGIPWLKDKADEWWTALVGQVFLLPVFLFFLMMTSVMLGNSYMTRLIGFFDAVNPLSQSVTNFQPGQWVYFGLIIGMLHLCIKMTKKMSGHVGDIMDKIGTGLKWATAAVVAVGASVVTGGAAAGPAASMLGRMAASTGGTGLARAVGRGGLSLARSGAGQAIRSGGRAAADVVDAPGFVGDMSRALLKESLGGIKKHTGLDIEAANKDLRDYQKNYNKYAGEQANKIGPGEVDAEIKNRKETMENIEAQAKNRLARGEDGKEIEKTLKDTAKEIAELTGAISGIDEEIKNTNDPAKKSALEKLRTDQRKELETIKNSKKEATDRQNALLDGLKKQIGQEMGYNTELHEAEMQMLGGEKIKREIALNTHLKNLSNSAWYSDKKAAETLRAVKGKYEEKSKAEKLIDDITKEAEKKAKEDAKKTA